MSIWFAALLIALLGAAVLRVFLRPLHALTLGGARAVIFLAHHGFNVGPSWRLLDDLTYLNQGEMLSQSSYSTWELIVSPEGRQLAMSAASSRHYVYGLMNSIAVEMSNNDAYWVPVSFNVVFSMATAAVLFLIGKRMGLHPRASAAIATFYVVHPEVIGWSTFVNLKDTMVALLVVITYYALLRLFSNESRWTRPVALGALVVLYLVWMGLRLYVPFLIVASLAFGYSQSLRRPWTLLAGCMVAIGTYVGSMSLLAREGLSQEIGISGVLSIPRGLVTPRPWTIDEAYSFLALPAVIHWVLLPFLVLGLIALYRLPVWGPVLVAFVAFTLLVGVAVPEIQGPRQRFQIQFIVVACQFVGCYMASTLHRGYLRHPNGLLVAKAKARDGGSSVPTR